MADNLEQLKGKVDEVAEKVKGLKSAIPVDKAAIGAAVKELLAAKQAYADANGGIGVDGKAVGGGEENKKKNGPSVQESDPNSKAAQKKAAKKAAKLAKKQAYTDGTAKPQGGAPGGKTPAAASGKPHASNAAAGKAGKAAPKGGISMVAPLTLTVNPNVPLADRPVLALSALVLTNTCQEINIQSDHTGESRLGTPEGPTLVGDAAIARYLARRKTSSSIAPLDSAQQALVDVWMDYAQSLSKLDAAQRVKAVSLTLQHHGQTYLVGHSISLADVAVFALMGFPSQTADLQVAVDSCPKEATAIRRWLKMMAAHPAIQEAAQLAVGITGVLEAQIDPNVELEPLVEGMSALEGALPGRVVTRFPPEPSGYLHVGHCKAALLNDYYARRYKGRLLLRFDDTNPSKEKAEFEESIQVDLQTLGIKPDSVTYTSDYFGVIRGYAHQLIDAGLAYMDDTPQEQMKTERMDRQNSKHRGQTPAEARELFELMCGGSEEGQPWCLRAKIDMSSDNGTLRDPVLFRPNTTPHHRSGTTYKAYPTYDLACPIVDSIEGVTHALRTTEYNDRDEQYQWMCRACGLRAPRIQTFSRVNFVNTLLSKRKLTWFVEKGYVTGWDDARFPTVRGIVRRGVSVSAMRSFMLSQGASRRVVNMEWSTFWSENKKEIDKVAKRFMAIDETQNVTLTVTNGPKADEYTYKKTQYHPKDPTMGNRVVRLCSEVLLEAMDADGVTVGEEIVLMRWGVVKVTKVDGSNIEGEYLPDGDFKAAKRKISWLAKVSNNTPAVLYEFDNLLSKDKLEDDDNFEDFINPDTLATTNVIGDAGLKTLEKGDVIQLERRGFYRVDAPYRGVENPLILYTIPDGRKKSMSGASGKLEHR